MRILVSMLMAVVLLASCGGESYKTAEMKAYQESTESPKFIEFGQGLVAYETVFKDLELGRLYALSALINDVYMIRTYYYDDWNESNTTFYLFSISGRTCKVRFEQNDEHLNYSKILHHEGLFSSDSLFIPELYKQHNTLKPM